MCIAVDGAMPRSAQWRYSDLRVSGTESGSGRFIHGGYRETRSLSGRLIGENLSSEFQARSRLALRNWSKVAALDEGDKTGQFLQLCPARFVSMIVPWTSRYWKPASMPDSLRRYLAIGVLCAALGPAASFAQPGSDGGSIGNDEKSVSGVRPQARSATPERGRTKKREATDPRLHSKAQPNSRSQTAAAPVSPASSCGNIVGTWNWPNGSQMAFYKNGTAGTAGAPAGGTWRCSGGTIVANFNNGGRDQYVVAPDGNSLSFTTNWIPGTYTATRKN